MLWRSPQHWSDFLHSALLTSGVFVTGATASDCSLCGAVDELNIALMITNAKKPAIIHVSNDVRFGVGAPHAGQDFAFLLTSCPHSLHLTSAMSLSSLGR